MATITIDDAELRALIRKYAQQAAAEYLISRTIPPYPAYFFEKDWLVTYDWARELAEAAERRAIETATWKIKRSFPMWLRWLIK